MTDLDALEAVLAKATQGEWENHRYWVRVGRSPVAQLPLDGPMNAAAIAALHNAAPALIAEHRALLARVAELEEGWKTLLKIIEKSVHPKEPPHRMIFADDHIETGRAVDAYCRMMQKMQTVARAALEPKP